MSFPRYAKYKDSGVEWLGVVPEHWAVLPCRAIVQERTVKNDGAECQDYLSLMANVGVIPYAEKGDIGNKKPEDLTKCKIVTRGDFVINSMNYGIGSYGISNYDGVCSPVYIVLKPRTRVVESRFAFRIFENRAFQTFAQSFGNGILEHRCAINWDILKPIGVGVPPMDEQKAILDFLDGETSKIDELVCEQRRLIELLKEKREAVIAHAVTKGLNPLAPLKPSGIQWLGDVPAHWVVGKLGHLFAEPPCYGVLVPDFDPYGVPMLRINDMNGRRIDRHQLVTISRELSDQYARSIVKAGDLIISVVGQLGVTRVVDDDLAGVNLSRNVARMQLGKRMYTQFARWLFSSNHFQHYVDLICVGTAQRLLNMSDLTAFIAACPPHNEQVAITRFLEVETSTIDALIDEAILGIDLLQERRTASTLR